MQRPIPLGRLQKGREKNGIMVRVVRKWTVKENSGQGDALYIGLVFANAKGDSMYAEIPKETIAAKEYLLEIGVVYTIKKFRVTKAKPSYKPFPASLMIELTEFTTIEATSNPPASIPRLIYKLTPFSAIVPVNGPVHTYTDVIGYITKYTGVSSFVPKNKEKVTILREIHLKDLRDNEMKITLWGDLATSFNIDHVYNENDGNLVVCLVVGCLPRRLFTDYNKPYLSASAACAYYLNPEIGEAEAYHTRFKNVPIYIDRPTGSQETSNVILQDIPLQLKTVADLNNIDPFDFENGKYKCAVTITSIPNPNAWWYMSCAPCKKKAEQQSDHKYRCPKCFGYDVIPRYSLPFIGQDDTDDARFFAFDEEARLIIQKDCDAVLNLLMNATGLPQPLQRIIGKAYVFGVDLSDESCASNLRRQYIVKSVLERPHRQLPAVDLTPSETNLQTIEAGPSSRSQLQTIVENADVPRPALSGREQIAVDKPGIIASESNPQTPPTVLLTATAQNAEVTPPPPPLDAITPAKKTAADAMMVTADVRRRLFDSEETDVERVCEHGAPKNAESPHEVDQDSSDSETLHRDKRKKRNSTPTSSQAAASK